MGLYSPLALGAVILDRLRREGGMNVVLAFFVLLMLSVFGISALAWVVIAHPVVSLWIVVLACVFVFIHRG